MKLLLDENLSPKLPRAIEALYPGSKHVRDCGLKGLPDDEIWDFARNNGYIIVSKDSDFHRRSLLFGPPPKIVWLRIGNCDSDDISRLLTVHEVDIRALNQDPIAAVLVLT